MDIMGKRKIGVHLAVLALALAFGAYFALSSTSNVQITGLATTDSQLGNLSASVQTYVACTWSTATLAVDFGSLLNPGENDINATDNNATSPGTGYNVTSSALSTSDVNVTILGNDLVDGSNTIAVGNITWAANETDSDGSNLVPGSSTSITGSAVNVAADLTPDSTVYYRFWMDIPASSVAGTYEGNYTIECTGA